MVLIGIGIAICFGVILTLVVLLIVLSIFVPGGFPVVIVALWAFALSVAIATSPSLQQELNDALASPEPVVLIGKPDSFYDPENDASEESARFSLWAKQLDEWIATSANEKKLKVVVVFRYTLAGALQTPAWSEKDTLTSRNCVTLFVKNKTDGLLHESDCMADWKAYELGASWLLGAPVSEEIERSFKPTPVVARGKVL
jgi:hypothetical protein